MKLWKTGWVTTCLIGYGNSTRDQGIVHCNDGDEPQMRIRIESNRFAAAFGNKIADFELVTKPLPGVDADFYERSIPNDELVVDFLTSTDCKFLNSHLKLSLKSFQSKVCADIILKIQICIYAIH